MPSSWHRGGYQEPTSGNMENGRVSYSLLIIQLQSDFHISIPQLLQELPRALGRDMPWR